MNTALIGLGTNLGDRLDNLQCALDHLSRHPNCELVAQSAIYETRPMGPQEQPDFLNAACRISTDLDPESLLDLCKGIEATMGRIAAERWGPRLIDLDLLLYNDWQHKSDRLEIPHPGLCERAFVLLPLNELVPDWRISGSSLTIRDMAERADSGGVRLL